jgi:circadian clock protein KaiC
MQFLSQSSAAEPGLHFGFFESPAQLIAKARRLGLVFEQKMAGGHLEVMWQPRGEYILDELAYRLLNTVRDNAVKRVVIDGLASFLDCATDQERLGRFLVCLMNELAARGAATVLTLESPESAGPRALPWEFGARVENILSMRFIGHGPVVKRSLLVAKVRDSRHEMAARDFEITGRGLSLGAMPGTRDDGPPEAAAQEGPD